MREPRLSANVKREVARRARYCCEYCGCQASYGSQPFTVDHIIPTATGGGDSLDNLAYACNGCNGHKHKKITATDPATKEIVALFHPRNQRWADHFVWNEDCSLMKGLSPTGRATIEALHLNRASVVNLRTALHAVGKHPPAEE